MYNVYDFNTLVKKKERLLTIVKQQSLWKKTNFVINNEIIIRPTILLQLKFRNFTSLSTQIFCLPKYNQKSLKVERQKKLPDFTSVKTDFDQGESKMLLVKHMHSLLPFLSILLLLSEVVSINGFRKCSIDKV